MAHRYVLTSQDTDINLVVNDPTNLALVLQQAFQNVPSRLAAGIGSSGKVFLGVSVELPCLPLHYSIHAEQFLVANLALHSVTQLTHLAVSNDNINFVFPCLECYYLLQEIHVPPNILIKNLSTNEYVTFGRVALELSDGVVFGSIPRHPFRESAHLLEIRDNNLSLLNANPDSMKLTALSAANRSFSPYEKSPSGVALKDCYGKVYRGWYMDSLMPNSSLGPLEVALVDFIIQGGTRFDDIVEAVLVEKNDAKTSPWMAMCNILKAIAPNCDLSLSYCLEP